MTRTTSTGKTTMAEADTNNVEFHAAMPHLTYSPEDLDDKFPPIHVPQDVEEDQEDQWSTWDGIAQRGEDIIREVMTRMTHEGRRRCEEQIGVSSTDTTTTSPTTTTTTTTTTTSTAQRDNDAVDGVAVGDAV